MTSIQAPPGQPWRLLVWDPSDPSDAKWLVATIDPAGVQPAEARPIRPAADKSVIGWLARATGLHNPQITAMSGALVWRVDEPRGDQP